MLFSRSPHAANTDADQRLSLVVSDGAAPLVAVAVRVNLTLLALQSLLPSLYISACSPTGLLGDTTKKEKLVRTGNQTGLWRMAARVHQCPRKSSVIRAPNIRFINGHFSLGREKLIREGATLLVDVPDALSDDASN